MNVYVLLFDEIVSYLRWRCPALLMLMLLVSFTEGLAVTLLLPLLSQVGITFTATQGNMGAALIHALASLPSAIGVGGTLGALIGIALLQFVLSVFLQWSVARTTQGYESRRRSLLFASFMRAKWEFMIARKTGELTNAIVSETDRAAQAFFVGLYLASTVIGVCIYLSYALIISWQITFGLITCAIAVIVAIWPLYRKSFALGSTLSPLNAELHSVLNERLSGIKIVKATTSENATAAQVNRIFHRLERTNTLCTFLPPLVRAVFEFLTFVFLAALFVFGGRVFDIPPGNVVVVFALFARLLPRITALQGYLHMLNTFLHSVETLAALQLAADSCAERTNGPANTEKLMVSVPACLELRSVGVQFGAQQVLDHVNLKVPVPGMVGIVGSSGAGKSTLVHTLLGLIEPCAGSILLGPYELRSVPLDAWRRTSGYVPQETILFHASIRENLTLGNPSASASDVERAARRAHALDFINKLPEGFDTIIGDQGVKLSGGQRQRLAIARALLTHPALLIMDEAMSALDAQSEAEVLGTLEELRKQMGILVVAHRLVTVRSADVIYVLESGRIVEAGAWGELMARRSRLYTLAEAQSLARDRVSLS